MTNSSDAVEIVLYLGILAILTKKAVVLIAFLLSCDEFHTRCLQFASQLSYVRIKLCCFCL